MVIRSSYPVCAFAVGHSVVTWSGGAVNAAVPASTPPTPHRGKGGFFVRRIASVSAFGGFTA
jgi:hypothetical protein